MLSVALLRASRLNSTKLISAVSLCTKKTKSDNSSSTSSSSSDDERHARPELKERSEIARERLNTLLAKIVQEDSTGAGAGKQPALKLAKAKSHRKADTRKEPGTESVKTEPVDKRVIKAAQDVAQSLGGDVKQTEWELLQKLLNPVKHETTAPTLSELVKDMQIERGAKPETSRAEQVRQLRQQNSKAASSQPQPHVQKRKPKQRLGEIVNTDDNINLHVQEHLGIFKPEDVQTWSDSSMNKTWNALHDRALQLSVTHPPENYFQQMILWTNQGKLWKFPIDNEQDMDEEKKVYFTEHIFLDKHLEGWCPPKGPIRHFMELVCVGLSKNSYLTVQMKVDHIEWFRDYFREKKQLLSEIGALPPGFDIEKGVIDSSK